MPAMLGPAFLDISKNSHVPLVQPLHYKEELRMWYLRIEVHDGLEPFL